jgi:hypothetical protein
MGLHLQVPICHQVDDQAQNLYTLLALTPLHFLQHSELTVRIMLTITGFIILQLGLYKRGELSSLRDMD